MTEFISNGESVTYILSGHFVNRPLKMDSTGWYQLSAVPRFEAGLLWSVCWIVAQPGVYFTGPDVSWTTQSKSHLREFLFIYFDTQGRKQPTLFFFLSNMPLQCYDWTFYCQPQWRHKGYNNAWPLVFLNEYKGVFKEGKGKS